VHPRDLEPIHSRRERRHIQKFSPALLGAIKIVAMAIPKIARALGYRVGARLRGVALLTPIIFVPQSEMLAQTPSRPGVVVTGEGIVSVTPDYAQIESGVTTRAKTAKDAVDANSQLMATVTSVLRASGVAENDVQTLRFSIQPIHAPGEPRAELKPTGYSVSNRVRVNIRQIDKLGEVLDRLVNAGVTDVGGIEFLVSDASKVLDRAREAAIVDARRKAGVYAQASGLRLGPIMWVKEEGGSAAHFDARARSERGRTGTYRHRRGHTWSES
jgi:uncharacterized protein